MTHWDAERIDGAVSRLATTTDDALVALVDSPGAAALLAEIMSTSRANSHATSTRPRAERRLPFRLLAVGLVAGAAAIVVAVATLGGSSSVGPRTALSPVAFHTAPHGYIVAVVTDPSASESRLRAAFEREGLDITVKLVPVSPSLVGKPSVDTIFSQGRSPQQIKNFGNGGCVSGGGACPIGVMIPRDFSGRAEITIGRPAKPGETYDGSDDAFGPGEALHCTGLLGQTVARALPVLRAKGLTARWTTDATVGNKTTETITSAPPSANHISDALPLSPSRVIIYSTPGPTSAMHSLAANPRYLAALNRGCAVTSP